MAAANGSVVGVMPAESDAHAGAIPQPRCYDDLVRLLLDVKTWARHRRMGELEIAMDEAIKLAGTGWTEVHESLFALGIAKGHIDAGRQSDAKRSVDVAIKYLRRWNGRQMRFEPAVIETRPTRMLTAEVRHG